MAPEHRVVEAPCVVFEDQNDLIAAFKRGELEKDFVAVVRFQGPAANGMPELHKMTPPLGLLQDKGYKVALVTDGRMSGASGKVPAAIHISPEASKGGMLNRLQTGDIVRLDAERGVIDVQLSGEALNARAQAEIQRSPQHLGRNLFSGYRSLVRVSELGASVFDFDFANQGKE